MRATHAFQRTLEHSRAIGVELRAVQVGVGVDQFDEACHGRYCTTEPGSRQVRER